MAPKARFDALKPLRAALLAALALWLAGCANTGEYFQHAGSGPRVEPRSLAEWPYRELWTGVVFNGAKIGFTRLALAPAADAPGRWDLESEAAIRLRFLGIDKRVNLRSRDRVREDLTLERFEYSYELDGSPLELRGESDGRRLTMRIRASGSSEERSVALAAPLYPQSAIALLPVMRGLAVGRRDRFSVLQGETQEIAQAEQSVDAWEASPLFEGPAFKLTTRLLGLDTHTWIAADGRPLFELALNGTMISALETEAEAKRSLVAATLNRNEALLDFSLLKAPPIANPRLVSRFEIELSGVPEDLAIPTAAQQACSRQRARVHCVIDRDAREDTAAPDLLERLLKPTLAAPSTEGMIVQLARSIIGNAVTAGDKLDRVLAWIDANIAKEAIDGFTAVDVLRERRAECQGHAALAAALLRALGVPVRVVNGIVYSEPHGGFLYHTWNEAWLEGRGWQAFDPTFGQARADATHVKLIEGESLASLVPLAAMVGKARIESVRALAHW